MAASDSRTGEEQAVGAPDFLPITCNLCVWTSHQFSVEYSSMCIYLVEQKPKKQQIDCNKSVRTVPSLFFLHLFHLEADLFYLYCSSQGEGRVSQILVLMAETGSRKMLGAGLQPNWGTLPCPGQCFCFSERNQPLLYCYPQNHVPTATPRTSQKPTSAFCILQKFFILSKLIVTLVNAYICLLFCSSATSFIHKHFLSV